MEKGWIVAVGASGDAGLENICSLMSALPADLDAIVMIVLHRPWSEPSQLREVLSRRSAMPVVIASQGDRLAPGTAYIGEPSVHLTLLERRFAFLTGDPDRLHGNRTVDLLFQSVADCGGSQTIGVVLSGSLDDGSRGLAAIHKAGGTTMVVRSPTKSTNSMPTNAIAYDGPVSVVGSEAELAFAITRHVTGSFECPIQ
ncbi:chemotaxis protein CheB [Pseudomonas sp. R1-18]|uniref:chemotaxis protein CheB n=1 Tax=Pseudomonas sp. R1-18 TaxID=1632772 RepID=UPI003DA92AE4